MIHFQCEHCGHAVRIPAAYSGKKGRCPACKRVVVIPSAEHDVPPPPAEKQLAEDDLELPSLEQDRSGDTYIMPQQTKADGDDQDEPQQLRPMPSVEPAARRPALVLLLRQRRTVALAALAALIVAAAVVWILLSF